MTKQRMFTRLNRQLPLILTMFVPVAANGAFNDYEFSGQVNVEYRYFFSEGEYGQDQHQPSLMLQPEWYWAIGEGNAGLSFAPFYRYDNMDDERTHGDIRELYYIDAWDDYEIVVGVSKVFWGVTESAHLVDVINQTDFVESLDGEDKLGQPMIHFSSIKDWGVTELFYLPYFRERTFPGIDGRLRTSVVVNTDKALFESDDEEKHGDVAIRYSNYFGDWDLGLSFLKGTDREPHLLVQGMELVPYYAQMTHTGLDAQGILGDWLIKLETIYRDSYENYTSAITGFEYTWVGPFDSYWDVGFIAEYLYDSRGEESMAIGQNDVFVGVRLAMNDEDSSELLISLTQDLDYSDVQIYRLEGSTRLTNHLSLQMEAWSFENDTLTDPLYSVKKDDFVQIGLEYYF